MIKNKTYRSFIPLELSNTDMPQCKLLAYYPSAAYQLSAIQLLYSKIIGSLFS